MIKLLLLTCFVGVSLGMYSPSDDVVELTETNFDRLVSQSDNIWIVEFYAPWCGHCQSLTPEYKKLATALKGIIKVGAVNADEQKSLGGQFGVRGFPTIKIFGQNKKSPTDFNGERTAKGMGEAALAEARKQIKSILDGGSSSSGGSGNKNSNGNDAIELTDSNFDKLVTDSDDVWLVEFYAPWCGHCKNLEPEWKKAATELKGKVKLGTLDATVHTIKAQQFGVQGYPTIKYFAGGKKDSDSAANYDGGRTASEIVTWALDKYADSVPAPEIVELTNEKVGRDTCEGKPLCIISILPHILDCDAKCRNDYIKILKELGDKYKQKQWGWIWAEAGAQPQVEESLEIGGFGYPAMAVANFKKLKYSQLRGSFSKTGISEFLRDIAFGRGQTAPLKSESFPKIYSNEAWDGKDGQLPEEEEIDLSDIDLDEKDEL